MEEYIIELKKNIDLIDLKEINKIVDFFLQIYEKENRFYIIGNGGSASTSSHFACDLSKGATVDNKKRFKVFSLADNLSLITAISNDISYDEIFSYQLKNVLTENDVLIAISASGNSPNIVKALKYAKEIGAKIIGFSGFSGGYLKENSDFNIHIASNNYGIVEDLHLVTEHIISQEIKKRLLINN